MKNILFLLSVILMIAYSCTKIDYDLDETYEKAEITGVELYNREMSRADLSSEINTESGTILIMLKEGEDITNLKIAVAASTGAIISPSMSVGFQDFSAPKTYEVTSPNNTVTKNWTITVQ